MGVNLAGIIGGAMQGAGEVGAAYLTRSALQEEAAKAQELRDQRMNEFQAGQNALNREHTSAEAAATREHASGEAGKTRAHQSNESALTRQHSSAEAALSRDLQRQLQAASEKAANSRHAQSIGIQMATLKATQEQVQLVPQSDGRVLKVDKSGNSVGYLSDPVTGADVKGKTISEVTTLLVKGNMEVIKALEVKAADPMSTPEERANLHKRIAEMNERNYTLLGEKNPQAAGNKNSGWDTATGKVIVNGVEIGTAKTFREADALHQKFIKGDAPKAKPEQADKPASGIIAGAQAQATQPVNAEDEKYQKEQREMETGKRTAYSEEVKAYLDRLKRARDDASSKFVDRERERAVNESKVQAGR